VKSPLDVDPDVRAPRAAAERDQLVPAVAAPAVVESDPHLAARLVGLRVERGVAGQRQADVAAGRLDDAHALETVARQSIARSPEDDSVWISWTSASWKV
jgi:hypothetical protein